MIDANRIDPRRFKGNLRSEFKTAWPCGVRAKYVSGCRCDDCTKANRDYANARALALVRGQGNPLVDAGPMREYLQQLAAKGIGARAVQAACDVARTVLRDVMAGRKHRVRAETVRRVLAVDEGARADSSFVDAKPTRAALREMLRMGWRKYEIAARLGSTAKQPSLQLLKSDQVLASTAQRVAKLLEVMREEARLEAEVGNICAQCGHSHEVESRLRLLRAHLGVPTPELRHAHPFACIYGPSETGYQRLRRDLIVLHRERDERDQAPAAMQESA